MNKIDQNLAKPSGKSPRDGRTDDELMLMLTVGRNVRLLRTRHGMTRRRLGSKTNISERYLGEVERGRANVTLGLLLRIADVLGEPLQTFIPATKNDPEISPPLAGLISRMDQHEQANTYRTLLRQKKPTEKRNRGVALIGLRGAGKSTLGTKLADLHGVSFLKLSDIIEDISGMAVGEIIELMGQKTYRRIERQALDRINESHSVAVIEAGGSLVQSRGSFDALLGRYLTVWIKATPEEHMQRVIDQGDLRPMAGNDLAMDELRLILNERELYYSQADYTIDTSQTSIEDSFEILRKFSKDGFKPGRR
ncbi:MAG: helix-turn-helix domain-containing protein [Rhizobiales bacterium]|nr:helix-turn-helix domain-containing protein [Hyphomicrobiales bacterium]